MRKKEKISAEEKLYVASQWQLIWRKFVKHKLAIFGGVILLLFYIVAIFCEFFSTQDIYKRYTKYIYCPPQRIHFFSEDGFHPRPFVYGLKRKLDLKTFRRRYFEDKSKKHYIYFFVHGDRYKLWNIFPTDVHLLGVKEGTLFLFGTDELGRDLLSRNLYAARISLSIGLVGVFLSFVLGCILGGISGYFGGTADMVIQRVIEFLISIPTIPLWMALSAALPQEWSPIRVYFGITIILSIVGWCGLARVVRGKFLELREEDFHPLHTPHDLRRDLLELSRLRTPPTGSQLGSPFERSSERENRCPSSLAPDSRSFRHHHRPGLQLLGRWSKRCS